MNGHPTSELVPSVAPARTLRPVQDMPHDWPRQGVAAALVVDRAGHEHVAPVIVVDFYRSAADANA